MKIIDQLGFSDAELEHGVNKLLSGMRMIILLGVSILIMVKLFDV
jgi:hypothetical protein